MNVDDFVRRKNIDRYRHMLTSGKLERNQQETVRQLLAKEEALLEEAAANNGQDEKHLGGS